MDKFLFYNGGMPIYLDDIKYLDSIYRETFKQLLQAFNLPNNISCIIKGCNVTETQNNYKISEGIIALNGEILMAPEQIVNKYNIQGQTYYWSIDTDFYGDGYKILENGQSVASWEQRWAFIAYGVPPALYLPMLGAKTLLDYINDYTSQKLINNVEPLTMITGFYPGWSSHSGLPVRVYKDLTGRVYLSGTVIKSINAGSNIFILHHNYRPLYTHDYNVFGLDALGQEIVARVLIATNGTVILSQNITNSEQIQSVSLDGISFRYLG